MVGDLKYALTVEVPGQNQELDFDVAWAIETSAGKYMKTAVKSIVAITPKVLLLRLLVCRVRPVLCVRVCDRSGWA